MAILVSGQFTPFSSSSIYAIVGAEHMNDGLRNVATLSDMYDITLLRRKKGMVVGVQADNSYWRLNADVGSVGTSGDWVHFDPSASSGATAIPNNEIAFGNATGTGIESSSKFTFDGNTVAVDDALMTVTKNQDTGGELLTLVNTYAGVDATAELLFNANSVNGVIGVASSTHTNYPKELFIANTTTYGKIVMYVNTNKTFEILDQYVFKGGDLDSNPTSYFEFAPGDNYTIYNDGHDIFSVTFDSAGNEELKFSSAANTRFLIQDSITLNIANAGNINNEIENNDFKVIKFGSTVMKISGDLYSNLEVSFGDLEDEHNSTTLKLYDATNTVDINAKLNVSSGITLENNYFVNELSNDVTLGDASTTALVTEYAIKAYVDAGGGGGGDSGVTDGTAQGQMLFWSAATSQWAYTETSELVWDDVNKSLGIGVSSPSYDLDVAQYIAIGGESIAYKTASNVYLGDVDGAALNVYLQNSSGADIVIYNTNDIDITGDEITITGDTVIIGEYLKLSQSITEVNAITTGITSNSTDEELPTAKAAYTKAQEAFQYYLASTLVVTKTLDFVPADSHYAGVKSMGDSIEDTGKYIIIAFNDSTTSDYKYHIIWRYNKKTGEITKQSITTTSSIGVDNHKCPAMLYTSEGALLVCMETLIGGHNSTIEVFRFPDVDDLTNYTSFIAGGSNSLAYPNLYESNGKIILESRRYYGWRNWIISTDDGISFGTAADWLDYGTANYWIYSNRVTGQPRDEEYSIVMIMPNYVNGGTNLYTYQYITFVKTNWDGNFYALDGTLLTYPTTGTELQSHLSWGYSGAATTAIYYMSHCVIEDGFIYGMGLIGTRTYPTPNVTDINSLQFIKVEIDGGAVTLGGLIDIDETTIPSDTISTSTYVIKVGNDFYVKVHTHTGLLIQYYKVHEDFNGMDLIYQEPKENYHRDMLYSRVNGYHADFDENTKNIRIFNTDTIKSPGASFLSLTDTPSSYNDGRILYESESGVIDYSGFTYSANTMLTVHGSVQEGVKTTASGSHSHAEGSETTAIGQATHTEGYKTEATGYYSHAEGWESKATEQAAHAEGRDTLASGFASHAEGSDTTASGSYAHAEGAGSAIALGLASHAAGYTTIAQGSGQVAIGRFNVAQGNSGGGVFPHQADWDDYVFIIGNGLSTGSRSDALAVDWYGNLFLSSGLTLGTTTQYVDEIVTTIESDSTNAQLPTAAAVYSALPDIANYYITSKTELISAIADVKANWDGGNIYFKGEIDCGDSTINIDASGIRFFGFGDGSLFFNATTTGRLKITESTHFEGVRFRVTSGAVYTKYLIQLDTPDLDVTFKSCKFINIIGYETYNLRIAMIQKTSGTTANTVSTILIDGCWFNVEDGFRGIGIKTTEQEAGTLRVIVQNQIPSQYVTGAGGDDFAYWLEHGGTVGAGQFDFFTDETAFLKHDLTDILLRKTNISNLSGETTASLDYIMFHDVTDNNVKKTTVADLLSKSLKGDTLDDISATENDDYIIIEMSGATTSDAIELWASQESDSTGFNLIGKINSDFVEEYMVIYDDSYTRNSQIWYKAYSLANGKYSIAVSTTITPTNEISGVTNMQVISENNKIFIEFDLPSDRRLSEIEIEHNAASEIANLLKASASIVYSGGIRDNYIYTIPINELGLYHQFWVNTITRP